ncbi:MAG: hypothetical protein J7578_10520 [Chitinophagaceae bacterium]|nr:hypothetical protein [Chitinophagaceae bacterium]
MRYLPLLAMPLILASCFTLPDKKKIEEQLEKTKTVNDHTYTDSRDTYMVTRTTKANGPIEEDGAVSLIATTDQLKTASGSYLDHFKEGTWIYNNNIKNITTVTWSKYEIGQFGIETNLSTKGSTRTIDDHTELYHLPVKEDSILIRFYADTLAARAKRRPYEDILTDLMEQKGLKLTQTTNKILEDSNNVISITSLIFTDSTGKSKEVSMEVASAQLPTGFLAFATMYHEKDQPSARIMFDGVLTNLYLNKARFYNPYKRIERTKIGRRN